MERALGAGLCATVLLLVGPFVDRAAVGEDCAEAFMAPVSHSVGEVPHHIVSGDFDGDGIADLAVAHPREKFASRHELTVLLGQGGGAFGEPIVTETGSRRTTQDLASADADGDGVDDLVAVSNVGGTRPGAVSVLLSRGDGTFDDPVLYEGGAGGRVLAVADFDADGAVDVAIANIGGDDVSILLGRGDGSFAPSKEYPTGDPVGVTGHVPRGITAADFNDDGRADVATGNIAYNETKGSASVVGEDVTVLLGEGDGSFTPSMPSDAGVVPDGLVHGDFDADGALDLAHTSTRVSDLTVLYGTGLGTFLPPVTHDVGPVGVRSPINSVDLDADGADDLVLPDPGEDAFVVLPGRAEGFGLPVRYPGGRAPTDVVAAHLDSDTSLDVATASSPFDEVSVVLDGCS